MRKCDFPICPQVLDAHRNETYLMETGRTPSEACGKEKWRPRLLYVRGLEEISQGLKFMFGRAGHDFTMGQREAAILWV